MLLIEDDDHVRSMRRQLLPCHGHTVVGTGNDREGLQRFQHGDTDLVITDLIMPETEGCGVLTELRKQHRG